MLLFVVVVELELEDSKDDPNPLNRFLFLDSVLLVLVLFAPKPMGGVGVLLVLVLLTPKPIGGVVVVVVVVVVV